MRDGPHVLRLRPGSGVAPVVHSCGKRVGVGIEVSFLLHQCGRDDVDLPDRFQQAALPGRHRDFLRGERILVTHVVDAEIVRHLVQRFGEFEPPEVEHDLGAALGAQSIVNLLEAAPRGQPGQPTRPSQPGQPETGLVDLQGSGRSGGSSRTEAQLRDTLPPFRLMHPDHLKVVGQPA